MRKSSIVKSLAIAAVAVATLTVSPVLFAAEKTAIDPLDWPHWRGPEMNGTSRETGLIESWSPKGKGKNVLWQRDDLGSRSTPIVMQGKLFTITRDQVGTPSEGEKVVCLDAATGKTIWENRFNVFLSAVPDFRVGWSSVVGDPTTGRVYALGACGLFQCIDGETGKTLWSHSLCEEYGLLSTYGGRTNFPIVHGDVVIISAIIIGWGEMAKPAHRFIGFDKRNGQAVWFTGTRPLPYDTTYSSPVLGVLDGQEAFVFGSGDGGVHAFQPQTGQRIWTYNTSRRGINVTPLIVGDRVFCSFSEENFKNPSKMGAIFAIDGTGKGDVTDTHEIWRRELIMAGKSSPLMIDGKLLSIDDRGTLLLIDPKTGKTLGKKKLRFTTSSPLYADGKIYTCSKEGNWSILKLDGNKVKTVQNLRLRGKHCSGSPIVSHGRIYLPLAETLYCLGTKDHKPAATPIPQQAAITPVDPGDKPVHVQVVPAEVLLKPGQKLQFQARLYNDRGQLLSATDADFSIDGPGTMSADGKFEAATDIAHAAVKVTAKVGALVGTSRIRVVPPLPWKFKFDDGQIPVTWVGARYRHIALDFDLLKKLEQENPLASQLYIYSMSGFVNSGRPALKYVDDSPRQTWQALLRFLNLLEGGDAVRTLVQAKATLDPALELLKKENVIAAWNWSVPQPNLIQLILKRGSRQVDGNGVMMKLKTIPKGQSSLALMGHVDLHDYTIQADVLGARKNNKMPDIGVIGQRYILKIMGNEQKLEILSWGAVKRMGKAIPFKWNPEVWYTLKFRTAVEEGKAVLRGKVWKRGDAEPADWMIEAVDETPNLVGSPGLRGNARDAELFIDNVQVTRNK